MTTQRGALINSGDDHRSKDDSDMVGEEEEFPRRINPKMQVKHRRHRRVCNVNFDWNRTIELFDKRDAERGKKLEEQRNGEDKMNESGKK